MHWITDCGRQLETTFNKQFATVADSVPTRYRDLHSFWPCRKSQKISVGKRLYASLAGGLWPGWSQGGWQSPLREKRGCAASTLHTHHQASLLVSRYTQHYTCPTPVAVHWASPQGRPHHWYLKIHVPPREKRKKEGGICLVVLLIAKLLVFLHVNNKTWTEHWY